MIFTVLQCDGDGCGTRLPERPEPVSIYELWADAERAGWSRTYAPKLYESYKLLCPTCAAIAAQGDNL